ncbi:MAG: HEAT repeat domain-containing protein [Thermoguttaceae bacterium]
MSLFTAVFAILVALLGATGCAVDNEYIAKLPLFEAKTDKIPGLQPPKERLKQIRLKGEKGANAPTAEKEILVAQLVVEYRTSPDPNMRREAVDAMAKIKHSKRDEYMKEILQDTDPFVRLSALDALGKSFNGNQEELLRIFVERLRTDPDKDVRLSATKLIGIQTPSQQPTIPHKNKIATQKMQEASLAALSDALYDKVPAIRYEAMQSLQKITMQDYGTDINKWQQYVQYTKGNGTAPQQRTFAEKLPQIQLPMFK